MTAKPLVVLMLFLMIASLAQAQPITITTLDCPQAYEIINDSVVCVSCSAGFTAINGTCKPNQTKDLNTANAQSLKSEIEKSIDATGEKITPENPSLGRAGIVLFALLMFVLVLSRLPNIMQKIFKR